MDAPQEILKIPPNMAGLGDMPDGLHAAMERLEVPDSLRYKADLVCEELVTNVVKYGGVAEDGPEVEITLFMNPHGLTLIFTDSGKPFDPVSAQEPIRPTNPEEILPGGLGLSLVRKSMRTMSWRLDHEGRNVVTVELV